MLDFHFGKNTTYYDSSPTVINHSGGTHDCDMYDTDRPYDRLACFLIIGRPVHCYVVGKLYFIVIITNKIFAVIPVCSEYIVYLCSLGFTDKSEKYFLIVTTAVTLYVDKKRNNDCIFGDN